MITDAKELQKNADFVRQAKERGYSAQQVDNFLKSKGSSLNEIAQFIEKNKDDVVTGTVKQGLDSLFLGFGANIGAAGNAIAHDMIENGVYNPFSKDAISPQEYRDRFNKNYEKELPREQAKMDAFAREHPILSTTAQFATPAGISAKAAGAIVKAPKVARALAKTKLGRGVKSFFTPAAMPLEYAGAAGAGALTGAVDPETTVGKIATGIAGGIAGAGVAGAINRFGPGAARNFIGRNALRNELENAATGRNVSDVPFGRMDKDIVSTINNMPELADNVIMNGNSVIIPARTVQKLYDKRVIGDKIAPDDLVDAAQHIFYGKGSSVTPSGNHNSVIFANKDTPSGYGIILPNKNDTGINAIETVIRAKPERIDTVINEANSRLDGRNGPSSPVINNNGARDLRISGLQPTDNTTISTKSANVKNRQQALRTLEKLLGRNRLNELVDTAQRQGVPLIDIGSENINQVARTARSVSPDANELLAKRFNDITENAPSTVARKIDDIFGTKNTVQNAEQLAATFDPMAQKNYEAAFTEIRDVPGEMRTKTVDSVLNKNDFNKIMKNPYIARAVDEAPGVHLEIAKKAPNTIRRLDFAKEMLDSRIGHEMAKPDGERNMRLVASLQNAKNELTSVLDNANQNYKTARAISQQKLSALDAQRYGATIDRADVSADAFIKRVSDMTDLEKSALRIGIRDYYKKGFEQAQNPAAFAARLLDTDAQRKLRAALPRAEADELINFARTMVNQNRAKNFIMGGSQTAETQVGIADAINGVQEIVDSPIRAPARKVAHTIDSERARRRYGNIAELLLADPQTLRLPHNSNTNMLLQSVQNMPASVPVNLLFEILNGNGGE